MSTVLQWISTFHSTRTETRMRLYNIIRVTLGDSDVTAPGVCHGRLQLSYQEGTRKLLLPTFPQSNVSGVHSNSAYDLFPKFGVSVGWSSLPPVVFTLTSFLRRLPVSTFLTFLLHEHLGLCPARTFSVNTDHRATSIVNSNFFISH